MGEQYQEFPSRKAEKRCFEKKIENNHQIAFLPLFSAPNSDQRAGTLIAPITKSYLKG
ncbi:hypothetical protein OAQ84_01895 [Bdellovibrionales bacterium]|nr:hypothetical protein [Bdellovibrionales bacterium]